jgi:hypothetical protein
MHKKTKSILEELSKVSFKHDSENFVESRASHIIDSAINLVYYIRENFDSQTAYTLEKRFNSAIKNLDGNKFTKGVSKIKEIKDLKNQFKIKQGELQDEDD